jgi:DNA polymerase-3 subunit beta
MELTIEREALVRGLGRVQGIVERRPSNPALSQVLIDARGEGVRFTATDSLITLVADYGAAVRETGQVCVDASTFFAVSKALSGSVVTLRTVSGNRLSVRCGSSEHNMLIGAVDDYPPVPVVNDKASLQINGRNLRRLIDESLFSVSNDDNRYGLNGAHAEEVVDADGGNRLRFVTTDGSRLSYSEALYEGRFGLGRKMLLPRKALNEVRKLADVDDANWEVSFGERTATFHTEGLTLFGRLIEGEFPEYRQVLPAHFKRKVVVESKGFLEALKNVRVMANDRNHLVRFSFEADRMVLSAQNVEAGDVRGEVPIELSGSPLLTGFNLTFFQDLLAATKAEKISLELGEALDPCIVRVVDRDDCLFVVMPMRLE